MVRTKAGLRLVTAGAVAEDVVEAAPMPAKRVRAKRAAKPAAVVSGDGYRDMALELIDANPDQPRKVFEAGALEELAASIKANGLLQPIVVRPREDGRFQIVAGERRWRAAKLAGLTEVAVRVMTLNDEATVILAITENVSRADMNDMEEANAYKSLLELGKTVPEVAMLFGKTVSTIEWSLMLLNLTPTLQWLVAKGEIGRNVGGYISRLTPEHQGAVLNKIVAGAFPNNDAIIRHCTAVQTIEAQGAMFTEEVDELTEKRRTARRTELEAAWDKIEKLAGALEPFMEATSEELAFALESRIALYADKLAVISKAVNRVRNNVRQGAALANVMVLDLYPEAVNG